MAEVKVSFGTVFSDKYFAVLIRAHRSRVDVDIRVQFLCCNGQPAAFEQASE